ncbi:hypothetical protein KPATCC21470_0539 [Kitasatospora purpeofusca]
MPGRAGPRRRGALGRAGSTIGRLVNGLEPDHWVGEQHRSG